MLTRKLEPEVIDTVEEAVDYDSMDHSSVNRVFVEDFLSVWDQTSETILDVGTGTAQIPIELCRQHHAVRITALDLAENMLRVGRQNVEQAGLQSSITLELIDAKAMPYESCSFGAVISNSIVHHIPRPEQVIAEMVRVVAHNGLLFVRDLMRPTSDEEVTNLVELYAGDCNDHQKQMFDDSLRAALSLEEMRQIVSGHGFQVETVQATTDRHWTWVAKAQ